MATASPVADRLPGSPAGAPATRVARLPDRGELVAYPGRVSRPDGAYTWFRSEVSEAHALHAIADGHLRLMTPEGQPIDVRYDRHVEHPSGDWTWIGHLPGDEGAQTIITFGERAVFGSIAQPGGAPPLRLTTLDGATWLVETDPTKAGAIVNSATRPTKPDFYMVPHGPAATGSVVRMAGAQATAAATANGATVVDLLIGYTGGLVTRLGSVSAVNTRLNNLVDIANAAYVNSQINAQVRIVHTMQVNYRDDNTNDTALQAMSGKDSSGRPGTVDPAFTALRSAREQYGADLVSLVRPFLTGTGDQGGCGLAWLIGGGLQGTNLAAGSDSYGYSVVGDGEDYDETDRKTYFCRDESLAHEMGHNEGSAHDRTTAQGTDGVLNNPDDYGAFAYSFGYRNTATVTVQGATYHGFYSIMAYGNSTTYQYGFRVFSNPRITICGGFPCGTTTNEDNARSLAQLIPVIATFRATAVPLGGTVRSDFNADGRSDILWRNYASGADVIWRSASAASPQAVATVADANWKIVGNGDFDGDGASDILWRNAATGANVIWRSGNSAAPIAVTTVTNLAWDIVGVGDIDGDGHADIVWRNHSTGADTVWRSGNSAAALPVTGVTNLAWKIVAVADFDGDGHDDLLWRNASTGANAIWRSANSSAALAVTTVADLNWAVVGAGDFNGDGRADIVWRNPATGANAIWRSGDSSTPQAVSTVADATWKIVGTGDYDGDAHADLLWRNTGSGANVIWKAGSSAAPLAVQAVADQNWRVAP